MGSIVHQNQTCGVLGGTIFSNLQLVRDTLDIIDKTNETGILLSFDQEKAFDRVDHDFLIRTLDLASRFVRGFVFFTLMSFPVSSLMAIFLDLFFLVEG